MNKKIKSLKKKIATKKKVSEPEETSEEENSEEEKEEFKEGSEQSIIDSEIAILQNTGIFRRELLIQLKDMSDNIGYQLEKLSKKFDDEEEDE